MEKHITIDEIESNSKEKLETISHIRNLEAAEKILPILSRVNILLVGSDESQVNLKDPRLGFVPALQQHLPDILDGLKADLYADLGNLTISEAPPVVPKQQDEEQSKELPTSAAVLPTSPTQTGNTDIEIVELPIGRK